MKMTSTTPVKNYRYVILEDNIPYDLDDYDLWGIVLYDTVDKVIITDKFGHGTDTDFRSDAIEVYKALEMNLVTCEEMIDVMFKSLGIGFNHIDISETSLKYSMNNPFDIPVKIVRGRTGKGVCGRLVYGTKVYDRYGWGSYHGKYSIKCVVYNPDTDEFLDVKSTNYLEVDETTITAYNNSLRAKIDNTLKEVINLAHAWAYGMSYSACDGYNYYNLIADYSRRGLNEHKPSELILTAINNYSENKKSTEMPKIIEWVKNNTDKKGDEILKLAEHIWNKHNSNK